MKTTAEAVSEAGRRGAQRAVDEIRANIDQTRRRGKRDFLRRHKASDFTVAEISVLLAGQDTWIRELQSHGHSQLAEDVFDQMLRGLDGEWPRDLHLSPWEVATSHRRSPCHDSKLCEPTCSNCHLYLCRICGGSEGSLLPYCPDRRLSYDEDAANYQHYCAGTGPFAKATEETVSVARARAHGLYLEGLPHESLGLKQLHEAVVELHDHIIGVGVLEDLL